MGSKKNFDDIFGVGKYVGRFGHYKFFYYFLIMKSYICNFVHPHYFGNLVPSLLSNFTAYFGPDAFGQFFEFS